jgi:hypothetical protein
MENLSGKRAESKTLSQYSHGMKEEYYYNIQ